MICIIIYYPFNAYSIFYVYIKKRVRNALSTCTDKTGATCRLLRTVEIRL